MLPAFFLGMYEFLSAPSARRATARRSSRPQSTRYFYPRPPRGGRRWYQSAGTSRWSISIHALREEGDTAVTGALQDPGIFLSTPSARRATPDRLSQSPFCEFLSTPSARRATNVFLLKNQGQRYFYPRPPRGGRPLCYPTAVCDGHFYPRPPRGGRPVSFSVCHIAVNISIHALREEGDRNALGS